MGFGRHSKLAQLEEVLDESCGNDVEDYLALELDDSPGPTIGTTLSVLHIILFQFVLWVWISWNVVDLKLTSTPYRTMELNLGL